MMAKQYKPNYLRAWRKLAGLTQAALAAKAGISQKQISLIENSKSGPSVPLLIALANIVKPENPLDLLDRSPDAFLGGRKFAEYLASHPIEKRFAQKSRAKGKKP